MKKYSLVEIAYMMGFTDGEINEQRYGNDSLAQQWHRDETTKEKLRMLRELESLPKGGQND